MRPRTFEEFEGQEHLVGEQGPLRKSVSRGHLTSLLLWGPPGTGKTTLARILAEAVGAEFITLSAVMSGVAEVRGAIAAAQERLALNGKRTVLFIDEIHRFNKAQQDALLPHVEDGTITLIGATTENPYFEVNSALLSRLRVWRLEPLTDEDVGVVVRRAIEDKERGLAGELGPEGGVALDDEALRAPRLDLGRRRPRGAQRPRGRGRARGVRGRPGQAGPRRAAPRGHRGRRPAADPPVRPRRRRPLRHRLRVHQEPSRQRRRRRAVLARGDDRGRRGPAVHRPPADHLGIRGRRATPTRAPSRSPSRPPRRLDHVGLPEAQYALAQATTYIATAPKSNRSGLAYWAAVGDVDAHGSLPVPLHLRTAANPRMKHHGIGVGYRYPHDFDGADVDQRYLPDALDGKRYYLPTDQGYESTISERLARRADARAKAKEAGRDAEEPLPGPGRPAERRPATLQRKREENRKKLAETEKRDAG